MNESTVIAPFSANTVDWDGDEGEQTFVSPPPQNMPVPPPGASDDPHAQGLAPTKLSRQVDLKKVLAVGGAVLFILVLVFILFIFITNS